ncbi:tyrosine-protein phosphatase [Salinibacterium sp. SYSU T00001]|uniref:tyrosine-protein phosphatase n=1 Tax=Homoserinimonas sedimenticola TaxID=2986805 RepID=UPI002235E525|nr:tyrosine-protein phosphatase [Salinibacterium sedimenticola]MCW4385370.1 tyrosine-protein phosphatase [Salinibacterium sedimenticola]
MTATIDIQLSSPVNLRDLGGTAIEGGIMREGLAVRADDLSVITETDAAALVERGLTAVIDLRSTFEVSMTGRGPLASQPVAYHHLPLLADIGEGMAGRGPAAFTHEAMGHSYVRMVDGAASQLATALTIMSLSPGATAFHCAAGRDRTGVLAALLLVSLGATDDEIVADYSRTEQNMAAIQKRIRPMMGAMLAQFGFDIDEMTAFAESKEPMAVSMRILLDGLRERHGDPLSPLRAAGLGDETIARLRARALAA